MNHFSCWLLALSIFLLTSCKFRQEPEAPRDSPRPRLDFTKLAVQDGDVVFRRGRSLNSHAVLLADGGARFSHVGVVIADALHASVVHAVPATEQDSGGVKIDSIEDFLSEKNAVTWGVYRLTRDDGGLFGKEAAKYAGEVGRRDIEFDSAFELMDGSKLYCTELVWRAYKAAGIDIVDGHFDRVQFPMLKADFAILPSRLENSHHLQQVLFPQDQGDNK